MWARLLDARGVARMGATGAHLVPRYCYPKPDGTEKQPLPVLHVAREVVSRTSVPLMIGGNSVVSVVFSAHTSHTLFGH